MEPILQGLNDAQTQAVKTTEGPLLILAGAGSGKTKTLTHRIAYLLASQNVWPENILAVTFTNKAAREMRERLAQLVGKHNSRGFMTWMGTFHGVCVRILRQDGEVIGVSHNFVIYDDDDRMGLVKQVMKSLSISADTVKPRAVVSAISNAKNDLIGPDEFAANAQYPFQQSVARIYAEYETARKAAHALDFDDLLIETVRLFRESAAVRKKYQEQFKYILIDEYQDTNAAQYAIVKSLVGPEKNLCVVGDDWQSIYSWRGADFKNILNFERDFPGALVIKLEQNYRSTESILDAAHSVIAKNVERTDKKLWTAIGKGLPVEVHAQIDEADEAMMVASRIRAQVGVAARTYGEFAVLYRMNAQSFALERAFMQQRIPYQLVGGTRFYDRREVKDILAYLRLIHQPNDRMSFTRIVNVPARGIGAVSLEKFLAWQLSTPFDIISALSNADQASRLTPRARTALAELGGKLANLRASAAANVAPSELIEQIIESFHYRNHILDGTPQAEEREANIGVMVSDAKAFSDLADFLEEAALMSSVDKATDTEKVTLMTLHAAKGLEFPVVFMVGLEDGVFPLSRAVEAGPRELEEERRLCYVGMTRAKEELHLSYAGSRLQFGQRSYSMPSRFLDDMGYSLAAMPRNQQSAHNEFDEYVMDYDVGDRVRSAQFGEGEIIDVDGLAVSVQFSTGGVKKLNVEYARLEKL